MSELFKQQSRLKNLWTPPVRCGTVKTTKTTSLADNQKGPDPVEAIGVGTTPVPLASAKGRTTSTDRTRGGFGRGVGVPTPFTFDRINTTP